MKKSIEDFLKKEDIYNALQFIDKNEREFPKLGCGRSKARNWILLHDGKEYYTKLVVYIAIYNFSSEKDETKFINNCNDFEKIKSEKEYGTHSHHVSSILKGFGFDVKEIEENVTEKETQHWLVGSHWASEDKTEEFLKGGYWEQGEDLNNAFSEIINNVKAGDKIALKTSRKQNPQALYIKASGEVLSNPQNGKRLKIKWARLERQRKTPLWTYVKRINLVRDRDHIEVIFYGNKIDNNKGNDNILNRILFGPPGTGKTFITKRKAIEVIENE